MMMMMRSRTPVGARTIVGSKEQEEKLKGYIASKAPGYSWWEQIDLDQKWPPLT
jgi:hypothetical protein